MSSKQTELTSIIGKPALRALNNEGIHTLEQVAKLDDKALLELHGVGPRTIRILKQLLKDRDLA
jgi:predicted flap endonuclease-1-like 5' DNA nuclease